MATELNDNRVAITDLNGGHPFHFLQNMDMKSLQEGTSPFTSTTSTVEYTISGRVVFRPIQKQTTQTT